MKNQSYLLDVGNEVQVPVVGAVELEGVPGEGAQQHPSECLGDVFVEDLALHLRFCDQYYRPKPLQLQFKSSPSQNSKRMSRDADSHHQILPARDQYNFEDSFVATPVDMHSVQGIPRARAGVRVTRDTATGTGFGLKNKLLLGDYDQYKITHLLGSSESEFAGSYGSKSTAEEGVIEVVTVDTDSSVVEIGEGFIQLMNKFISQEVAFVVVAGDSQTGKSFFCDKLLNLAQIKGNNFCQKKQPGIFTYQTSFVKEELNIFILEISGCQLGSTTFKMLNAIALSLCSCYIFMGDFVKQGSANELKVLNEALNSSFKMFDLSDANINNFNANLLYLARNASSLVSSGILDEHNQKFFNEAQQAPLPDAKALNYKGSNSDLIHVSLLDKECINPDYIRHASKIFSQAYHSTSQKRYNELMMNGNIAKKLLLLLVPLLNSRKTIRLGQLYANIIDDLYVSAYNYCILTYQQELEQYFLDEQPKNTNEMYAVFGKASDTAIQRFNEFNLDRKLHQEYELKLLDHIDKKEQLICSINRQKTQECLRTELAKLRLSDDAGEAAKQIKNFRPDLNDGRAEALVEVVGELIQKSGSGNGRLMHVIQKLITKKQQLQLKLNEVESRRREDEIVKSQFVQLEKKQASIDKNIKSLQVQLQTSKKRQLSLSNDVYDAEILEQVKKERTKLIQKDKEVKLALQSYRKQNNEATLQQIRQSQEQKIAAIHQRVVKLQEQIKKLEAENGPKMTKPKEAKQPPKEVKQQLKNPAKPAGQKSQVKGSSKPKP